MDDVTPNEAGSSFIIDDDDFLVDDDGHTIDAAAEGSCLMAEGLLEMARAETGEDYVVVEPYIPDFDVAAVQAKATAFFEKNAARDDAEARNSTLHEESQSEDNEHEEDEADNEFPTMGSRDMTDPDDWILEAILKRKLNKDKEGGLWIYLCKWKGHEETSWETREVMEDAGWIKQLDAFDDKGGQTSNGHSGPKLSKPETHHLKNAATLESFFGATDSEIAKQIISKGLIGSQCHFQIMHYCRMNAALATPFLKRWEECQDTHVPTIVFHGTRAKNFESIYNIGLVTGGTKNIKIINGAVHGNGVYTASTPFTPMGYSDISNALIVCIGLVPIDEKWPTVYRTSSQYLIFREACDVYPMWLVQFAGSMKPAGLTQVSTQKFIALSLQSFGPIKTWKCPKYYPISESKDEKLSEFENHTVNRALTAICDSKGNIKKAALKGQPRRIKELLARAAAERRK